MMAPTSLIRFRHLISVYFTLIATNGCVANLHNATSKLMIHIPRSLFKVEGYDHQKATFGVPQYGGSLAQNVYYADSDLCDPNNVDTRKGYPAREKDDTGLMGHWPSPFILMVDRGIAENDCSFVQKVRNAQHAGAAGVIIADNTCLCSDQKCLERQSQTTQTISQSRVVCETSEPIMADDGSGSDVSIPSFVMHKHDADMVKEELKANQPVQIEMAWSSPDTDNRVEYDLWVVPTTADSNSIDFMKDFKVVAIALGNRAYFTPHMYVYDGVRSGCTDRENGQNLCHNLCTNNGRYCASDLDHDINHGISGADVVTESLRRLCIWRHYGADDGIGEIWWDYVSEFTTRCSKTAGHFANEKCIKDAYKYAGVDESVVNQCMEHSGSLKEDTSNVFLDTELSSQDQNGVVIVPTTIINARHNALSGALTAGSVFKAICAEYKEALTPDICNQCSACHDSIGCIRSGGRCPIVGIRNGSTTPLLAGSASRHFAMFFMFAFAVGISSIAVVSHYKRSRDEMRHHVRSILAEYMPLEDQEDAPAY